MGDLTNIANKNFVGASPKLNDHVFVMGAEHNGKFTPMATVEQAEVLTFDADGNPTKGGKAILTPDKAAMQRDGAADKLDKYIDKMREAGFDVQSNPDGTYTLNNVDISGSLVKDRDGMTTSVGITAIAPDGGLVDMGSPPPMRVHGTNIIISLKPTVDDGNGQPVIGSDGRPMIASDLPNVPTSHLTSEAAEANFLEERLLRASAGSSAYTSQIMNNVLNIIGDSNVIGQGNMSPEDLSGKWDCWGRTRIPSAELITPAQENASADMTQKLNSFGMN